MKLTLIELPVRCRIVNARRLTPLHWALLRALQLFPAGNRLPLAAFAVRLGLPVNPPATRGAGPDNSSPPLSQTSQPVASVRFVSPGSGPSSATPPASSQAAASTHSSSQDQSGSSLLTLAWEELLKHHAVDSASFQEAVLTIEGQDALRLGYFPLGSAEDQERLLHFDLDGHPRPFSRLSVTGTHVQSPFAADTPQASASTHSTRLQAQPGSSSSVPSLTSSSTPARSHPLPTPPSWKSALTPDLLATHLRSPACSSPLAEMEELQSLHPLWPQARLLASAPRLPRD